METCFHHHHGRLPGRVAWHVGLVFLSIVAPAARPAWGQMPFTSDPSRAAVLLARAEAQSPELRGLAAKLNAARARTRSVGAIPVALSVELEEIPGGVNVADAGSMKMELSRAIPFGGRAGAARALAAADVDRASIALDAARRKLRARTLLLLDQLGALSAIAGYLAAEDSLLVDAEHAQRNRFAVADARYVDVLRLRTERLRLHAELSDVYADAAAARRHLLALLGEDSVPPANMQHTMDSLIADVAPGVQAAWPAEPGLDTLVQAATPVRLANIAVQRSRAAARIATAEQAPVVELSIGAQRFERAIGPGYGAVIGASVSLPFTTLGSNRASREAARNDVDGATAEYDHALKTARAELGSALDRYVTSRSRLEAADATLIQRAREERESVLAAYRSGELSLVELLDFERALTHAYVVWFRTGLQAASAYAVLAGGGDLERSTGWPPTHSEGGRE